MKKYELLNELLNEKAAAIKTIEELCDEWNITLSNSQTQIVIQKGKVTQIVKEVTNDNEVKVYKGMVAGYEAQLQNKDLTIDSLEKQIADMKEDKLRKEMKSNKNNNDYEEIIKELKDELFAKELLLNEFRENMDEKIKTTHELEDKIEDLEIELESKDMFIEGMKLSYEQQIAELKATIRRLNTKIMFLEAEDEVFEEEEEIVADNEGGDAVPLFNIPEEYKDNQEIKEVVRIQTDKWLNARAVGPFTKEEMQDKCIAAANMTIETIIAEQKKAKEYNIRYTKLHNEKDQTVVAVKGEITLGGKPYVFKYGATHEYPCVYGCMDMELIKEAKDALDKAIHMIKDETTKKHAYDVVYAFDKGFVAWQTDDGAFKGYTKDYAFVWDGTSAVPCGATVRNALDEMKPYRKMNASWGNGFVKRANDIMAFCRTIDKRTKQTKEIVKETEEKLNVAQEIDDLDI